MSSDPAWLTEEQQRVWRSWLTLNTLLPATIHRELQLDAGLSLPDFQVLVQLTDRADARVRVSELASDLLWERSRLSHHVARMERRGLVRRETCAEDGRGAFIALTDHGREVIEEAAPGHVRTVRRVVFDALTEEELRGFESVVEKVLSRLEAEPTPAPV